MFFYNSIYYLFNYYYYYSFSFARARFVVGARFYDCSEYSRAHVSPVWWAPLEWYVRWLLSLQQSTSSGWSMRNRVHDRVMLVHRERRESSKRTKSSIGASGVSVCEFVSMGEVERSARNGTPMGTRTHANAFTRTRTQSERHRIVVAVLLNFVFNKQG